jgi:hypothetical protein
MTRLRRQYVMRVPLATADEKGYDSSSTTARRRSIDSRAISLPTGGTREGDQDFRHDDHRPVGVGRLAPGRGLSSHRDGESRCLPSPSPYLLAGQCALLAVHAQHIQAVPGRQTDVKDAVWIAELLRHGLWRGSCIPSRPQRQLRELTRYRRTLVQDRTRARNRLQAV